MNTLPRRANPRLTRRVLGFRVTPRTRDGYMAGLAASILLVGCSDIPTRIMHHIGIG